ncbi:hypothetical protein BGX28_009965 [Mortierella sp. GBA30]|nr:hypothetical protein BGX28_009965 [Mortierella sp. GBA30]
MSENGPYKWANWDQDQSGACHESGAILKLYPNGTFTYSANCWTDFSWGIWHEYFQLKDAVGHGLYTTSAYSGPVMQAQATPYTYSMNGVFDQDMYDRMDQVHRISSC